jgi:hypothetical protein
MSPWSATTSRANKEHEETLIDMGLPILALSELIPFSRCAPADRCEAINRYHRPIVFPLRFRLNRNRKAEVNMNITPIEKVAYIAKTQPPG